jgi:histidinol-phosphate/aromatic aminotransferase/cobyric acid decarboxylase-like protein
MASAGATLLHESAFAQLSMVNREIPADAVRINANENPLGPCAEALDAMSSALRRGGRYWYEDGRTFERTLAELEGVRPEYVRGYGGSSLPLIHAVFAFTSRERGLVVADPTYEAPGRAAQFTGAKVSAVPLTSDYRHDVKAMAAADPNAGLIYICTPNNPTGTLTPKEDIVWLLKNKPAGAVLLVDEAYLHFVDAPACSDLVTADGDLIILRTFSKLYGMAGLRAGAAIGRPDLLAKLAPYHSGALPLTGVIGATASLRSKSLVPERRKLNAEVREQTFEWLSKKNIKFVPSVSNCFMVDCGRPGREVMDALFKESVLVGRSWPVWPNHVRVTVGTAEEMKKFQAAFARVISA